MPTELGLGYRSPRKVKMEIPAKERLSTTGRLCNRLVSRGWRATSWNSAKRLPASGRYLVPLYQVLIYQN